MNNTTSPPSYRRLMIVQPLLASYRIPFFTDLMADFETVDVCFEHTTKGGFNELPDLPFNGHHTPRTNLLGGRLYIQWGLLRRLIFQRPSALFLVADLRAVHFWFLVLAAWALRIPSFAHGQGVYDKTNRASFPIYWRVLSMLLRFITSYVSYTPSVRDQMLTCGAPEHKISALKNSVVNEVTVSPDVRAESDASRLLFIGRLRPGCGLETLFESILELKARGQILPLDIIGDGEAGPALKAQAEKTGLDITFHGKVYDDKKIAEIASNCKLGIYPGDAGLSVVHYMSLSLVPVVHGQLDHHMGPEPAYIKNGENGLFFERDSAKDLARALQEAIRDPAYISAMSSAAFATYKDLVNPPMATQFIEIVERYGVAKKR